MISNLYIIPTYHCNLRCSHCEIHNKLCQEDMSTFLTQFSTLEYFNGILFGGEPLLVSDNLERIFKTNHVETISTNLTLLTDRHVQLFRAFNIDVSTSWNPVRFTNVEYNVWLKNLEKLVLAEIPTTILITLTSDLLDSNILAVLGKLNSLGKFNVKFETYFPATAQLITEADNWLVEITKKWKWQNLANVLKSEYQHGNIHLCRNIWSLEPNGQLINSCPTMSKNYSLDDCYRCKYAQICKPCQKQSICTFYQTFYEFVMEHN